MLITIYAISLVLSWFLVRNLMDKNKRIPLGLVFFVITPIVNTVTAVISLIVFIDLKSHDDNSMISKAVRKFFYLK